MRDPVVVDTGYIDRQSFTTDGRTYRVRWYPYSDLVDGPAGLLPLHPSVWLLLAGGLLLWSSRRASPAVRRSAVCAALLFVGVMAFAFPIQPTVATMGGSAGRVKSREDFEFFFGGRIRFEKHLSQAILLERYQALGDGPDAPERALVDLTRGGTLWFLLTALAVGWVEAWSPRVVRYLALGLLAPSALLYCGWREFGYFSLSLATFPLLVRGLDDDTLRLEAGSAAAGIGAALHGTGLVSMVGAGLAALGSGRHRFDWLRHALRVTAWGTAAYLGWVVLYMMVMGLPLTPDPGPASFSSWRPWLVNEVRGGRVAAALFSRTTARDLLMTAWVTGAPLLIVATTLWSRQAREVRAMVLYALPSVLFITFRWPYDGVGGGMDLMVAGFPALYALTWVCAQDSRRTLWAAALLMSGHYAFWRVVLDTAFVP